MGKSALLVGTSKTAFDHKRDFGWARERSAEMWTLNNFFMARWLLPYHFDKVFQCHEIDIGNLWQENYNLCESNIVIFDTMDKVFSSIERKELFDISAAEREFGSSMLTSSFCYMLLHAWRLGFDDIRLCGIRMERGGEYEYQVPAILQWLYKLRMYGVSVSADYESDWLDTMKKVDWGKVSAPKQAYGRRGFVVPAKAAI